MVSTGYLPVCCAGRGWVSVASPQDSQLQLVGVGLRAVWAVTRDHRVWFRRGLGGAAGGQDDSNDRDTGTAWLLMVGSLSLITLGPNDQVRKKSGLSCNGEKSKYFCTFHVFE